MFFEIIFFLLVAFVLLLPLVFWMYIFTSFYTYGLTRSEFTLGSLWGAVSTLPLVLHERLFFGPILEKFFYSYERLEWLDIFGYLLFFFMIVFLILSLSYFFQLNKKKFLSVYMRSFCFFCGIIFLVSLGMFLSSNFLLYHVDLVYVSFGTILFWTFGSIFWYYLSIALFEEGLKYLSGISFSWRGNYFSLFQKYLCLTACIALGFAFFENILYAYNYISSSWTIDGGLLSLVFFRSLFTIILHLSSSIIFALGFWYILWGFWAHIQTWLYGIFFTFLALLHHSFFDTALTYGYTGILFFYLIAMYILLSYITVQTG